jgi:glycosyltransferase involved in cell wall biosynthesis
MSIQSPCVSVCLPVYDGENYIREAIRSVLDQTFEDFELIISDNASTDRTPDICREVAARDQRVRYFRADVNRGLAWNFNRAFELATGRYLMWMGHDDIMGREYISRCVEAMEQNPGAVVCFSYENHIDENGNLIRKVESQNDADSNRPNERFKNLIRLDHWCDAIFGLMRTEVLKQTRLHGGFADSDRVLLAEMGLRGRFSLIPDYLFSRRTHSLGTTWRYKDRRERTLIFDPGKAGKTIFPVLLLANGFFSAVNRARLPGGERYRCYKHLLRWLLTYRSRVSKDLIIGIKCTIRSYMYDEQVVRLKSAVRRFRKHSVV